LFLPLAVRYVPIRLASELLPGERCIVHVDGVGSVGVFNANGKFHALKNVCPHQGAPLCAGTLTGTTRPVFCVGKKPELEWVRDGEILRCPWHGWEFDLTTGQALTSGPFRVASYKVVVGDDKTTLPKVDRYSVVEDQGMLLLVLPR
jgi:3-phenylpropionate/trans-cinnamate dioxygenase ferredoxin subunit